MSTAHFLSFPFYYDYNTPDVFSAQLDICNELRHESKQSFPGNEILSFMEENDWKVLKHSCYIGNQDGRHQETAAEVLQRRGEYLWVSGQLRMRFIMPEDKVNFKQGL